MYHGRLLPIPILILTARRALSTPILCTGKRGRHLSRAQKAMYIVICQISDVHISSFPKPCPTPPDAKTLTGRGSIARYPSISAISLTPSTAPSVRAGGPCRGSMFLANLASVLQAAALP